jgi:hypothetical protein
MKKSSMTSIYTFPAMTYLTGPKPGESPVRASPKSSASPTSVSPPYLPVRRGWLHDQLIDSLQFD